MFPIQPVQTQNSVYVSQHKLSFGSSVVGANSVGLKTRKPASHFNLFTRLTGFLSRFQSSSTDNPKKPRVLRGIRKGEWIAIRGARRLDVVNGMRTVNYSQAPIDSFAKLIPPKGSNSKVTVFRSLGPDFNDPNVLEFIRGLGVNAVVNVSALTELQEKILRNNGIDYNRFDPHTLLTHLTGGLTNTGLGYHQLVDKMMSSPRGVLIYGNPPGYDQVGLGYTAAIALVRKLQGYTDNNILAEIETLGGDKLAAESTLTFLKTRK